MIAAVLSAGVIVVGFLFYQPAPKIANAFADYKVYQNVTELEDDSVAIIIAQMIGTRTKKHYYADTGTLVYTNSKTSVKAINVLKGNIEVGATVNIYEPAHINEQTGVYHTTEGYNLMNPNGKYVLFLRESTNTPGDYIPLGVHQGKFDLLAPDQVPTGIKEASNAEKIKAEFFGDQVQVAHFNKLKQQVINKYSYMTNKEG